MKISRPDGSEATVKITSTTEFRKDREPAKLKDFKVGDGVVVRGEENPDYSFTAQMIVGRNGNGPNGPNRQNPVGTLGKDFVIGEVKALDPPSITVMRTDNVKQTFELNEDTSLRKGRESVTMADVQVGDHIFARGALQDNQFVPKTVTVIAPDQWKRMQELGVTSPAAGRATQQGNAQGGTAGSATKATPGAASGAAPSKPTEPPELKLVAASGILVLTAACVLPSGTRTGAAYYAAECSEQRHHRIPHQVRRQVPSKIPELAKRRCLEKQTASPTSPTSSQTTPQAVPQASAPAVAYQISGSVRSAKTPLPGVTVTATNTLTGKKFFDRDRARWNIPTLAGIPRGRYVVRVEFMGFASATQEVVLNPTNTSGKVDAELLLASRQQQQSNTANAALTAATGRVLPKHGHGQRAFGAFRRRASHRHRWRPSGKLWRYRLAAAKWRGSGRPNGIGEHQRRARPHAGFWFRQRG